MASRLIYHNGYDMHALIFKVTLAETCAKCERYIGTEGGGMDQSISFLAEEGTVRAVYLSFLT